MIRELSVYRCICSKCKGTWITKDHALPVRCAKCNVKTWNDDFDFSEAQIEAPALRTETAQLIQITNPTDDKQIKLERARAALMSVESRVFVPAVEDEPEWQFAKDDPQYGEDGNVYRRQGMCVSGKWKFRSVQVDENDHDEVVRIV